MTQIQEVTQPKFKVGERIFHSKVEAEGYLVYEDNKALIEGFIVHAQVEKAQAGLLRRLLPQFIKFDETFTPPVQEAAPEAPEAPAPAADAGNAG